MCLLYSAEQVRWEVGVNSAGDIMRIKATQGQTGEEVQATMGYVVTTEDQATIYHVTNHDNVDSIARNGIVANMKNRIECFFNFFTPNGAARAAENIDREPPRGFAKVEIWPYKWEQKLHRDVYFSLT